MRIIPLAEYYEKHSDQIEAMIPVAKPGESSLLLDFATALVPIIKKHWPSLNANGLLDDTLDLLKQETA
jgi:hypothetical protein